MAVNKKGILQRCIPQVWQVSCIPPHKINRFHQHLQVTHVLVNKIQVLHILIDTKY